MAQNVTKHMRNGYGIPGVDLVVVEGAAPLEEAGEDTVVSLGIPMHPLMNVIVRALCSACSVFCSSGLSQIKAVNFHSPSPMQLIIQNCRN